MLIASVKNCSLYTILTGYSTTRGSYSTDKDDEILECC